MPVELALVMSSHVAAIVSCLSCLSVGPGQSAYHFGPDLSGHPV